MVFARHGTLTRRRCHTLASLVVGPGWLSCSRLMVAAGKLATTPLLAALSITMYAIEQNIAAFVGETSQILYILIHDPYYLRQA